MSNNNTNSNKINVPEARAAMEQFKFEVANEIGVPLKKGYNGDLTSAQNGYVGGYMEKNMIENQEKMMDAKGLFFIHKSLSAFYLQGQPVFSLTTVPSLSFMLERTTKGISNFFASSTQRLCSTCAPFNAMCNISS